MTAKLLSNYLLLISILSAAVLRVVVPWGVVFKDGGVVFTEVDPYYYMRLADTIIRHWQSNVADPYMMGMVNQSSNVVFAWLLSVISTGNPAWLDATAAFVPAVCGVALVVVVYLLGKKLFGLWAGVVGAVMVCTVQGYMLARTSLGFVDHHCLEILLSMGVLCAIVYALKGKAWVAIIAGLLLGAYIIIWSGSPLLLMALCIYTVVQSVINHVARNTDTHFYLVMFTVSFIAMCVFVFAPVTSEMSYVVVVLFSAVLPLLLYAVSRVMSKLPVVAYPACLVVGGALVVGTAWVVMPDVFGVVQSGLQSLTSGGVGIVSETQGLTFENMWGNLGVISVFGLLGLVVMAFKESWKDGSVAVVVVVSVVMLVVSYSMRRFMYYVEPLMVVCCAYLVVKLVTGLIKDKTEEIKFVSIVCAVVFCGAFIVVPNTVAAVRQNSINGFAPPTAWREACSWMRYNTEEPFGNGNYYYSVYKDGDIGQGYRVLSWWDKGYWVVRMAHRPVVANPGGGNIQLTCAILLDGNVDDAMVLIKQAKIKYVMLDYAMVGIEWDKIGGKAVVEQTFIGQMWNNDNTKDWNKVWQSKEMYGDVAQVKVYKIRSDYGKAE